MKLSVVIPTYNEKDNIHRLIEKVSSVCKKLKCQLEIIVVDDNSPDGTANVVEKLSSRFEIKLIKRKGKFGLGSAYVEGFKRALKNKSSLIFQMDADLSHDPKYIPKFIEKLDDGYDVVIGSRLMKGGGIIGWNWYRKLVSLGGNLIGRIIAGIKISDLTSGYRAYRRKVLENIELDEIKSKSYDFQLDILARILKKEFKVCSIPIIFKNRIYGKSKLATWDKIRFFITALKIRLGIV